MNGCKRRFTTEMAGKDEGYKQIGCHLFFAKLAAVLVVLSMTFILFGCSGTYADSGQRVELPDPMLKEAVTESLKEAGVTVDGDKITAGDMAKLEELRVGSPAFQQYCIENNIPDGLFYTVAIDSEIQDLTGLEYAVNLTDIRLPSNKISDLSPLAGMEKLNTLWLGGNNIQDITPLSGLTHLEDLSLFGNRIEDVSPLSKLTRLTDLALNRNNVSDISALSGMTNMTTLGLAENKIKDISALSGMVKLELLYLDQEVYSLNPDVTLLLQQRGCKTY